jgi:hypothetical protein
MTDDSIDVKLPCFCPICGWQGHLWGPVLAGPFMWVRKECPRCGSYPRDRIAYALLIHDVRRRIGNRMAVVEIGASPKSYWWKRRSFSYWNSDVGHELSDTVDFRIKNGIVRGAPGDADVALLSYVLSMVTEKRERVSLLRELYRLTKTSGRLILFDDVVQQSMKHVRTKHDAYFHRIRLGLALLDELADAQWIPVVIASGQPGYVAMDLELPFILAAKQDSTYGLKRWVTDGLKELA